MHMASPFDPEKFQTVIESFLGGIFWHHGTGLKNELP
jgi:hypothetical protein